MFNDAYYVFQVNSWLKLRTGINSYFCSLGMPEPMEHPIVTKFYKGLRKRANRLRPRATRRTEAIFAPLLTKINRANLLVC